MSFKILGFGDPHINSKEDFNPSTLQHWLRQLEEDDDEDMYDLGFVVGDVVDHVPNDRIEEGTMEEDLEAGRYFFEGLSDIGYEFDFPFLAISGNHDHDIHEELVEPFDNVYNGVGSVHGSEEMGTKPGHTFVTRGATQFNLRPEIDYRNYSFYQDADNRMERKNALTDLEHVLLHAGEAKHDLETIEEVEDKLGIQDNERERFRNEILDYFDQYDEVRGLFEDAIDQYGEENDIVYANHIAPFNTRLDPKKVDGEQVEHWGSISDKNAINVYEPVAELNGHQHIGGVDYVSGYDKGTTVMNLGKGKVTEIELENGVRPNTLN